MDCSLGYLNTTLKCFPAFFKPTANPLEPLWWALLSPSYLFVVHFISFSSSAVSRFPARATLTPLNLLQNDLSVKSDPFRLGRTGLCMPKSCWWGPNVRCVLHGSKKRSPYIATVTLDCVDSDEGCGSGGVHPIFVNQISIFLSSGNGDSRGSMWKWAKYVKSETLKKCEHWRESWDGDTGETSWSGKKDVYKGEKLHRRQKNLCVSSFPLVKQARIVWQW